MKALRFQRKIIKKPRFKLGTQEDANKFNKGGAQIIFIKRRKYG